MALRGKQARFVEEYLVDLNGTQAAIRAGYSAKTAQEQSSRLLSNVIVQAAIQAGRAALSTRTEITQDRVLKEYARIAFLDPRKLFDGTGRPLSIHELDDDTAAAIAGLDVCQVGNSEVGVGDVLKYKLADKKGALDSVARHLGMFVDKSETKVSVDQVPKLEIVLNK
jgi:phage terminase small subunit